MSDNNFSEEEKEMQQKFLRLFDEMEKKEDIFWQEEYPTKSREEKVKAWLAGIHTGMRYQGESTGDEYSQFSFRWYQSVKSREPAFDDLFKDVVKKLRADFDWKEYKRRISG